ncbi:MAG: hypothetical protein ACRD2G_10965 [Terriglobia bacterium]
MKRVLSITLLIALLAAYALSSAWAQQNAQRASQRTAGPEEPNNGRFGNPNIFGMNYQDYFYGVITKVEPDALVLGKTKVGIPQTVRLTKKTKYVRDGKKSTFAQLKTGEMVYIDVKTDKKTGSMTARKVVSGMDVTVAP